MVTLASSALAQEVVPPPELADITSPVLTAPPWIGRATAEDYRRHYPLRAMSEGIGGRVMLDCLVEDAGLLDCSVVSEAPADYGFGPAALRVSRYFRVAENTADGRDTKGGRVRLPIQFQMR